MSSSRLLRVQGRQASRCPVRLAVAVIVAAPMAAAAADVAALKVIHSFNGPGPGYPNTELIVGSDGKLHGTTSYTRCCAGGFAFRVTPNGHLTMRHEFVGRDGSVPGGPIQGHDGRFYGVTQYGGKLGQGTVYRISPEGAYSQLRYFSAWAHGGGYQPASGLVELVDGEFYGTTYAGGEFGFGTVYRMRLK